MVEQVVPLGHEALEARETCAGEPTAERLGQHCEHLYSRPGQPASGPVIMNLGTFSGRQCLGGSSETL